MGNTLMESSPKVIPRPHAPIDRNINGSPVIGATYIRPKDQNMSVDDTSSPRASAHVNLPMDVSARGLENGPMRGTKRSAAPTPALSPAHSPARSPARSPGGSGSYPSLPVSGNDLYPQLASSHGGSASHSHIGGSSYPNVVGAMGNYSRQVGGYLHLGPYSGQRPSGVYAQPEISSAHNSGSGAFSSGSGAFPPGGVWIPPANEGSGAYYSHAHSSAEACYNYESLQHSSSSQSRSHSAVVLGRAAVSSPMNRMGTPTHRHSSSSNAGSVRIPVPNGTPDPAAGRKSHTADSIVVRSSGAVFPNSRTPSEAGEPPLSARRREPSIDRIMDFSLEHNVDPVRDRSFERNWPPPAPRDIVSHSSQLATQHSHATQQSHMMQQSQTQQSHVTVMQQSHAMQQSNYLHRSDSGVRESSSKSNSRAPSLCLTPPTMPGAGNLTMSTRMAVAQQLALDDQQEVVARSSGAIFPKSLSRASSEVSLDGSALVPPPVVKPPQVARGLQISLNAHGEYLADGELYAYRPPQCSDLSRLVTYCSDGTELFQLPSLWMVLRPDDCPLVWIVLQDCANLPLQWTSGSQLTVEWAAPQAPDQNRLGCTVTGEAPLEAVLGLDEGLVRADATNAKMPGDKQTRLLLNPQCGRIICRWLRHAQQVGIMI